MRVLFVAIAGPEIGYGHLSRCLSLAECGRRQGIESAFLLFGSPAALMHLEQARFTGSVRPLAEMDATIAEYFDATVIDFAHPMVFAGIDGARQLFRQLRLRTRTMMVIDALGDQALVPRAPGMPADVVVVPYVGASTTSDGPWKTLAGPEYAVLAPAYEDLPTRQVRLSADRVLVCCGGADPNNLTLSILDGIELVPAALTLRVVVGPLFQRSLTDALKGRAAGSHHSIELLRSPKGLADHMQWSDLAVAASGLIKYELAATATPAILVSIDRSHDIVNRPFAGIGVARDLGVEFEPQAVADMVAELLADQTIRAAMAEAGKRLVDGKGASRVIAYLEGMCRVAR